MKLARYGLPGQERPVAIDPDGNPRDLSGIIPDIGGEVLTSAGLDRLRAVDLSTLPLVPANTRIGQAVAQVGKVICVGLNFRDHAMESNLPVPELPVLFMKATTSLCGPNDDVHIPRGSEKTDWEVELGVVIGDIARDVSVEAAMDHVAGYTIVHDVSERAFQMEHGGQWMKGKGCDTFGPIGPWLVTRDEVVDPQALNMWLKVNGHRYHLGTCADMVFGVAELISHISRYMTLMPPRYLVHGDVVELGIEGLGAQRQRFVSAEG